MHIEFKSLCNASKHMNIHISNAINHSSWACSPYCVLLLSKNFDPFTSFNVAPPLCLCPCPTSTSLSQSFPKLSYLWTISPLLSSISIKGVLLIDAKVCIWGRWLRLESHLIVGMTPIVALEIPHIGFLTLIPICGTPPPMHSMGHPFDKLEHL